MLCNTEGTNPGPLEKAGGTVGGRCQTCLGFCPGMQSPGRFPSAGKVPQYRVMFVSFMRSEKPWGWGTPARDSAIFLAKGCGTWL